MSDTFKQFVDNLPTNCLSVFDHFVGLALERSNCIFRYFYRIQRGINNKLEGILIIRFNFADLFAAILTSSTLENNSQNIPKKLWRNFKTLSQKLYSQNLPYPFSWEFSKISEETFFSAPLQHSPVVSKFRNLSWQNLVYVNHKDTNLCEPY